MEDIRATVVKFLTEYGFQIIGALIILSIGAFVARWIGRAADQFFTKKQVEPPIRMLAVRVIKLLVFALAAVLAMDKCGVPIVPMIAGIGVAGVGIGLALQHVLSNLVAGLTIIFSKPFRVGEYIDVAGVSGQVTEVKLFTTTLLHADRSRVVVPNRKLVGEILHNYGTLRQLDFSVGVGYGTDFKEAIAVVREILARNPRVKKEPVAVVGVTALGDFAVNIAVKPWVSVDDFGSAGTEIPLAILEEFRLKRIEIPFPQREVRLLDGGSSSEAVSVSAAQRLG